MSNHSADQAEDVGVSVPQQQLNKQPDDNTKCNTTTDVKIAYKILEHDRHGSTEFKGSKDYRLSTGLGCGTLDKAEFKKQKEIRRQKSGPTGLAPEERRQLHDAGLSKTRSDPQHDATEKSDKNAKPQAEHDAKKDAKKDDKTSDAKKDEKNDSKKKDDKKDESKDQKQDQKKGDKKDEKQGDKKGDTKEEQHEHRKPANEAVEHRLEGDDLNLDEDKIVSPKKDITPPDHVLDVDKDTPDNWVPRSEEQVRLTGVHPLNSEQSLKVLEREGLITSNAVHYVRNHGAVPKLDWKTHKVNVSGLVNKPKEFTMDELVGMPSINIPVTISCDGNRRKEVNAIRHSKGFDWGSGGIGTAFWRGVKLSDILSQVGVKSYADGAKYVCFDGADDPKNGTYGTSIPLAIALDPANDIILAYQMNDQQLPPDHGYPVRLVIPGWVGGRMIKWLKSIEVTSEESKSWYHWHDNRVMPSYVGFTKADREDWWKRGDLLLNEQNVNSIIYSPAHGDVIDLHGDTKENISIKGIAYSGGGREVTRVEVSLDDGQTWMGTEREFPKHSVRHGYKRWAWCHWKLDLPKWKLLVGDGIKVRAWDQAANTQPRDITWNLLGMFNNSWYTVKKRLLDVKGDDGKITFDHPTVPGPEKGGWMATQITPIVKDLKHTPPYRLISPDEVSKHNKPDDPWIIVDGVVYDLTEFTEMHPGGEASIVVNAGKDITALFNSIHGEDAKKWMQNFSIGFVSELGEGQFLPGLARDSRWALQPRKWIDVTLAARDKISPDSYRFKFALKDKQSKPLGLPVGQHVLLEAHLGGGHLVIRPYTPTAPIAEDDESGVIEMVIKIYRSGSNPHFNQGGIMTQYLEKLELGSTLRIKGPEGHLHYQSRGILQVHGHPIRVRRISMIAGGTGITPMYQLVKAILDDPDDTTELALVYSNHTLNDILLKDELDELAQKHHNFKLWYTVSDSPGPEWKFGVGRIDVKMLNEHLFQPGSGSVALVCGPPAMVSLAALPMLEKMGFTDDTTFEF